MIAGYKSVAAGAEIIDREVRRLERGVRCDDVEEIDCFPYIPYDLRRSMMASGERFLGPKS
jgi:hypothetical protein